MSKANEALNRMAENARELGLDYEPEQPAQPLPFGVGGGLVAIKTLLSRDPCVHANTAIQMIDSILADQPAQETAPLRDAIVANLVREGINKHKARELADHFINLTNAQPTVPDLIHHTDTSETLEYIQGWNDCRAETLKMRKP